MARGLWWSLAGERLLDGCQEHGLSVNSTAVAASSPFGLWFKPTKSSGVGVLAPQVLASTACGPFVIRYLEAVL